MIDLTESLSFVNSIVVRGERMDIYGSLSAHDHNTSTAGHLCNTRQMALTFAPAWFNQVLRAGSGACFPLVLGT